MGFTEERERLLEAAVDAVLAEGPHLSNRALGAAIGTSHRVLDYYFGGRDALLEAVLVRLSDRLRENLPDPARYESRDEAIRAFAATVAAAPADQGASVWLDVLASAARGQTPFVTAATRVIQCWHEWLRHALELDETGADAVIAAVEGAGVIALTRSPEAAEQALHLLLQAPSMPGGG